MMLKQIPNALTLFRLMLIIPFMMFLHDHEYKNALYVFFLAGFTDGLDGWLARNFDWQSSFGSFVDPVADKLLVASSFISLALLGSLPWWLVILVFSRDFCISLGVIAWFLFIEIEFDFKPTLLSKFNTTFQLMLVTLCLFQLAYFKFSSYILDVLIYLTAATTAITFVHYAYLAYNRAWPQKKRA